MNASPRINSEACQKCGKCCQNYKLWYPNWWPEDKQHEMIRIAYSAGMNVTIEEDDGGHWLVFNHPCQFLRYEGGVYSCGIYDEPCRPKICETFPYPSSTVKDCPYIDGIR